MPITDITSNPHDLTMTVIADYPVPVERLWEAYANPRLLERFWGPEEWPATFTRHDMAVGGQSNYYMTGPDGTRAGGWFRFLAVEPRTRIEVEDGFGENADTPTPDMPTMHMVFTFEAIGAGSRVTNTTTFPSIEAMEQLVAMGMDEGLSAAMGQMDGILAEAAA